MGDQVSFPNTLTPQSTLQQVIAWLNAFSVAVQSASARNLIQNVGASGEALSSFTDAQAGQFPYFTGPTSVALANAASVAQMAATGLVFTVANLPPAAQSRGVRACVSDAMATTFAASVVGGGSNFAPVYCDGVIWRVG